MILKVTAQDIRNGKRADKNRCVIAKAIADAVPEARYILVDPYDTGTIRFSDVERRERRIYRVPKRIQSFISRWDRGEVAERSHQFVLGADDLLKVTPMKDRPAERVLDLPTPRPSTYGRRNQRRVLV